MNDSPLKEKSSKIGNVKNADLKVAEPAERVKEYSKNSATKIGDTAKWTAQLKEKSSKIGNVKNAGLKVTGAAGRVKEYGSKTISAMQKGDTPEEGTVQAVKAFSAEAGRDVKSAAKKPVQAAKDKAIRHIKDKAKEGLKQHHKQELKIKGNAPERASSKTAKETSKATQKAAKETVRTAERAADKTVRTAERTVEKTAKSTSKTIGKGVQTAGRAGMKTGTWAAKSSAKMTSWAAKSTVKMTSWAAKQTAKAAAKTAQVTVKASAKAAQTAVKTSVYAVKAAATAGKVAVTVIAALLKSLIAFIAAGGWIILLIIILVAIIYFILNGVTGMLYTVDESGDYTALVTEVSSLTESYYDQAQSSLNHYKKSYAVNGNEPELILDGVNLPNDGGELFYPDNLHDVLAVFYTEVLSGQSGVESLNFLSEDRKKRLEEIFWDMNSLNISVKKVEEVREEPDEEAGEIKGKLIQKIVHVKVVSKSLSAWQIADQYGFTEEQRSILEDYMSDEAYQIIAEVIGTSAYGIYGGEPIKINADTPTSMIGYTIVENAKHYLGKSYSSMDCSALVRAAYTDTGLDWSGTSTTMAKNCVSMNVVIDKDQLQPGDLVFWQSIDPVKGKPYCGNSRCTGVCKRWNMIHHVAIYAGDNKVIESVSKGVSINGLWETHKWKIAFYARPYVQNNS